MVKLIVVREVGRSGGEYHLAEGKIIEVREDTAEALMAAYPDCLEIVTDEEVDNG